MDIRAIHANNLGYTLATVEAGTERTHDLKGWLEVHVRRTEWRGCLTILSIVPSL